MRVIAIMLLGGLIGCLPAMSLGQEPDMTELERWLESDDPLPPSVSTDQVNEGELVFLLQPPAKQVHHHQNHLVIDANSLHNGWVRLTQCHDNLDRVAQAEERIRAAASGIRRRDFAPQPTWMACGQCPFREICPHTARGSEGEA